MTPNLYICSTYYHVLVTLCKVLKSDQRADIVLCDDIPEAKTLMESLIRAGCFSNVIYFDKNQVHEYLGKNKLDWVFFQHRRSRRKIEKEFKLDVSRYQDIYIYHDDILLGHYLNDIRRPYHLLEDSQDFYKVIQNTPFARCLPQSGLKYKLRRFLRSGYFPLGQSPYVIDVEVNDKRDLAIHHRHIVELPKDKLFAQVGEEEKKRIYSIFMREVNLHSFPPHATLLLTQPLWKDGYAETMEVQIQVYREIVKKYVPLTSLLVIKPHPRDDCIYQNIFPSAVVINKNIPAEILNYNPDIQFDTALTFFSSALSGIHFAKRKIKVDIERECMYVSHNSTYSS